MLFLGGLFGKRNEVRRDRRHAYGPAILPHTGVFQSFRLCLHWITNLPDNRASYSSITGIGRSNCLNSSPKAKAYRLRSSASGMWNVEYGCCIADTKPQRFFHCRHQTHPCISGSACAQEGDHLASPLTSAVALFQFLPE